MSGGSIGVVEDRTWALRRFTVLVSAVDVLVLVLAPQVAPGDGRGVTGSGEPLLDAFYQGPPSAFSEARSGRVRWAKT